MKKSNTKKSSTSKDAKLPKIANSTQKSKSPAKGGKSNSKSKNNSKVNVLKTSANLKKEDPKALKLEEYNEKRKKRIEQEKKEEARDKKVYDQVLKEYQEKSKARTNTEVNVKNRLTSPKSRDDDLNNIQLPKIKISEKKTQAILEEGGMLDAYKYLVIQLCKNGLPTGNLFEYSAYVIRNYEKKWKEKKSKMNKEKLEQYWKEKKQEVEKFEKQQKKSPDPKQKVIKTTKEEENKIKALNRSLEQREINKLIANMDKSRSSRNYQSFEKFKKNKSEEQLPIISDKNKVSVNQKEGKNAKKGNKSKSPTSAKSNKSPKKNNEKAKSPASAKKSNLKKK
jgi:hypothetical protein